MQPLPRNLGFFGWRLQEGSVVGWEMGFLDAGEELFGCVVLDGVNEPSVTFL